MWDSGVPKFHIENDDVDLAFDIYKGKYLFKGHETKDYEQEEYILSHFDEWYDELHKGHCMCAWEWLKLQYIRHEFHIENEGEFPEEIARFGDMFKISNYRSVGKERAVFNAHNYSQPFPFGKFDVNIYDEEFGDPRFHIENNYADLVFSIEDGRFLYKADKTLKQDAEDYIFWNEPNWFKENKELLMHTWDSSHFNEDVFIDPNVRIRNIQKWVEEDDDEEEDE
jgi:hypothetical protein